jgi:ATP-dependent RNA helicase DHX37/DHR1
MNQFYFSFKKSDSSSGPTKILSKRKRKELTLIVDKKRKKEERGELIKSLEAVKVSEDELKRMTSLSTIQTKGVKRMNKEAELRREVLEMENASEDKTNPENTTSILLRGKAWKRKAVIKLPPGAGREERLKKKYGEENVLGIEDESSEEEEEEEVEEVDVDEEDEEEESEEEETEIKPVEEEEPKKCERKKEETPVQKLIFRPTTNVPVNRTEEMQNIREKLPIVAEEQIIMETINENPVVILAGETGSGKTTQVPQFLYEAGYATKGKIIGVTEPRRVAAMAMARRVGDEMGDSSLSSHQIRFERNVTDDTRIKFMTDGVLLREMAKDFRNKNTKSTRKFLTQCSAIFTEDIAA